ncbi:MAG: response regulator [Kofleriaceae bacterium]
MSPSETFLSIKPTMLDGLKILFVDDDADVLHLVKTLLVNAHAEVVTAGSGQEALALLDTVRPDVIISDISMPGFDGYQFITALRDRENLTPAIALTAQTRTKDHQKALDAGFNMHLRKPMRALTLIAAISELVAP